MKEVLSPMTKESYDSLRKALIEAGFVVKTKWRKGLKTITLGDIVLWEGNNGRKRTKKTNS